jgi:sulfopyruvate decarboxylase subunit alpha
VESSDAVYDGLKKAGINFVVSLPCINLGKVLELIDKDDELIHVPVTREEEGFGICAGAFLGGKNCSILMQNSGLGNSVNAIASLYKLYNFPLLMVMSHRGTLNEKISAQIPMGKATPKILNSLNISYFYPKTPEEAFSTIINAWTLSKTGNSLVGVLLDNMYW